MKILTYIVNTLPVPRGNARTIPIVEYVSNIDRTWESQIRVPITLEISDDIDAATFCIIPYTWNTYQTSGTTDRVIELAHRYPHKYFIIWSVGDFENLIPISNAIIFQNGLHRSLKRAQAYSFELPAFWPDYLSIYCDGKLQLRQKNPRPSVGFCGQAASPLHKLAAFTLLNVARNFKYRIGRSKIVPPPVKPSVLFRNQALRILTNSADIDTNFIIRDRYRAGIRSKAERDDPFHPTKVEFVNNILDNDYTVCVRGGGNFSVRLYETLSLGRIPIFIDTDSRLPYDFLLNWKDYCVWVDRCDVHRLPEILIEFHHRLSDQEFFELQRKCRDIWQEWLWKDGFLSHFAEHLMYVLGQLAFDNVTTSI